MGRKDGDTIINRRFYMANVFKKILGVQEKEEKLRELRHVCSEYDRNRKRLQDLATSLYNKRKGYIIVIDDIVKKANGIDNLPKWCKDSFSESYRQVENFQLAVEYEKDPQKFAEVTDKTGRTAAYVGAGTATGAAIATLGPTAAMSLATVLGTASTGTAISALSGVAATNAALAWLGGGTIAAGGAGMAGGSLVLGMFGPIGIAIAGVSAASGFAMLRSKNRKQAEEVAKYIESIHHDNKNLSQKLQHLWAILNRSDYNSVTRLKPSQEWIKKVLPKDYKLWDDNQKHELEMLLNTISITVQLINERV